MVAPKEGLGGGGEGELSPISHHCPRMQQRISCQLMSLRAATLQLWVMPLPARSLPKGCICGAKLVLLAEGHLQGSSRALGRGAHASTV